jgi:hypothetical protein
MHEVNLRTLTERHVITFRKQLINLLYQPAWVILVKLGEINMTPLIILILAANFLYYDIVSARKKMHLLDLRIKTINFLFYSYVFNSSQK